MFSVIVAFPILYMIYPNLPLLLISSVEVDVENRDFTMYSICLFVDVVMHAQLLVMAVIVVYFILLFINTVQENIETQQ